MTEQEMQVAISEKCDLEDIHRSTRNGKRDVNGVRLLYLSSATGGEREYSDVPNYPECLNACHEMEKVLRKDQRWSYISALVELTKTESLEEYAEAFVLSHATALQRCTAFCRVFWPEKFIYGR